MQLNYSWHIQPSKLLKFFLVGGYVVASVVCLWNSLPFLIQISLFMTILFCGFTEIRQLSNSNWQLNYSDELEWQLSEAGENRKIEILPSTVASRYFIFLHFRCEHKNVYRCILKDSLATASNDYRQLLCSIIMH